MGRRDRGRVAAALAGGVTATIVGIGRTRFSSGADVSAAALAAQAIAAALRDARLSVEDVDGVVRFDREAAWEYDLPGVVRLHALPYYGAVPDLPGSAPAMVLLAAMAVAQGMARVVVGYHARAERRPPVADDVLAAIGAQPEPAVASQGGCAFVVTGIEHPARAAVRILGSMQAAIPSAARHLDAWRAIRRDGALRVAAHRLFAMAGVAPRDVDVACLYAHPPALVDLARDDFGLGDASPCVNPHAGGPDAGALDGADDLLEAVRQLRGEATHQVAGARVALVAGSPLEPTSAVLLGAAP
jgi:hypothetical protein